MAEMIPDRSPEDQNESEVFELLKNDENTKEWIVLHSLNLSNRGEGKPYGEIDFVIIIPGEGIICMEVKGGIIDEQDGEWFRYKKNREKYEVKNPFIQAKDSTLALEERIKKKFENSGESKCPVGRMVCFTDIPCPSQTTEFDSWEVIDCNDLSGNRLISSFIKKAAKEWRQKLPKSVAPTRSEAKNIREYLRPCSPISVKSWIKQSEDQLVRLTEEQYLILESSKKLPHLLIEGAAGTGKTVLAVEFALRMSNEGKKVLLICYNRLLGQSLEARTEKYPNITAGTFHKVLKNLIEKSSFKNLFITERRYQDDQELYDKMDSDQMYYDKTYIDYGQLALDEEELGPQYDLVVVDEAQDLIFRKGVLDVLNAALYGGLSDGRWSMLGDFSRQNIFYHNGKDQNAESKLKSYGKGLDFSGPLVLPVNCRNTKRIAEATYRFSGFDGPPCRLGKESGLEVKYEYWEGMEGLTKCLGERINKLLQAGISLEDIVILSPARLRSRLKILGFSIEDVSYRAYPRRRKKIVRVSSIKSFKGLESVVIILVLGTEEMFGNNSESLRYVAMSRARSLLVVLMDQRGKRHIQKSHPELIA